MLRLIVFVQRFLLRLSYAWYRLATPASKRESIDWVVGVNELASMVYQVSRALPGSYSVSLARGGAYNFDYDVMYRRGASASANARRALIIGPLVLGRLMNEARGFLYVGASGFLTESADRRAFEFAFLKKHGLKIGVYWCGSEIRSTAKMHELERNTGLANISTYIGILNPYFETELHERVQQERARVANRYADVMFDNPIDQSSYLTGHREPFYYFMNDNRFADNEAKFDDLSRPVITHGTTSPVIKGTALVRAAIAKLREEGYDFEYVELIGVSNEKLLSELRRSHIALNQLYGFTTTVFGIEALAAQCAVLSSTDETIEPHMPPHTNKAMMVTKHWQVYDHLRQLLDEPERIKPLALYGQAWARVYASVSTTGPVLQGILDAVLDGSYDREARALVSREGRYGDQPPIAEPR